MSEQTQYVVRTEGMVDSYGLGEVVSENVVLFRAGNYHLNLDELNFKLLKATTPKKAH